MKHFLIALSIGALASTIAVVDSWAQATAQISGTVTDPTGALLPGVDITATQTDTALVRNTVSNETGAFDLTNLPIGPFRLEVSLPGFQTFVQTGIVLQVNDNAAFRVVLQVGQVAQTIEVQANAAMVETRNVGIGQIMENQQILELPLDGRNVAELVTLAGGAVEVGQTSANISFQAMPLLSVAGGYSGSTGIRLDGVDYQDRYQNAGFPLPFPDALQEFSTQTSGLTAQSRQPTSVSAATRSGTNEYHGNLFYFHRNDLFNARNYFSSTGSTLKRNQFGGTVGGPIIGNKLFFFGGYQGTTIRQDPSDDEAFVPTAAMLNGDLRDFNSAACGGGKPLSFVRNGVELFNNDIIDPAEFSRAAVNISALLPTTEDPCGQLRFGNLSVEDASQFVGRSDYQQTDNHSLFGRAVITTRDEPFTFDRQPEFRMFSGNEKFDRLGQSYAFGSTYLMGPNTVQSFRFSVNRTVIQGSVEPLLDPVAEGINFHPYLEGRVGLAINDGFPSLGGGGKRSVTNTVYQLADDVNLLRGAHQFGFGMNLARHRVVSYTSSRSEGVFEFTGEVTGLGLVDFLLGRVALFEQNRPNQNHSESWYAGAYASDTWGITPDLTLSIGLRWDPHIPQWSPIDQNYMFDIARFRQGLKSSVIPTAPAGLLYLGDSEFVGRAGYNKDWWRFAPRVGLAWDVTGDGRTSVRAAYGVSRDVLPALWPGNIRTNAPYGSRVSLPFPVGGLDDVFQGFPGGNPFPSDASEKAIYPLGSQYGSGDPDSPQPSAATWNLSLQRQIGEDWALSTSYMGSFAYHVWTANAINPGVFFPGDSDANGNCSAEGFTLNLGRAGRTCSTSRNVNARRRLNLIDPVEGAFFGNTAEFDPGATQNYHGLLVTLRRRVATGLNFSSNYTWSHCISDGDNQLTRFSIGGDRTYLVPDNRQADRGECSFDRRHVFNLTLVAESPEFSNPTLRMLASDWRLSGIYRVSAGQPVNIVTGRRALTGTARDRPVQTQGNAYDDQSGDPLSQYLNEAAFGSPGPGTLGVNHNSLIGPGTWDFDLSLARTFEIREDQRLELRAEAYNVTNSFRPTMHSRFNNLRNRNFGVIRDSDTPRILQFALKYIF